MDGGRQHENGRHKPDYYRGSHSPVMRKQQKLPNFLLISFLFLHAIVLNGIEMKCAVEYDAPASSKGTKCLSHE
jgi:hypothetical protein